MSVLQRGLLNQHAVFTVVSIRPRTAFITNAEGSTRHAEASDTASGRNDAHLTCQIGRHAMRFHIAKIRTQDYLFSLFVVWAMFERRIVRRFLYFWVLFTENPNLTSNIAQIRAQD